MPNQGDSRDPRDHVLRRITLRVDQMEGAIGQIVIIKSAIETTSKQLEILARRDEELSAALRQIGENNNKAFDDFRNVLQKQRTEHQDAMMERDERWRQTLDRLEDQHKISNEKIVQEAISQISNMAIRGAWGTFTEWLKPLALAAIIGFVGWCVHIFF